VLRKWPVYLDQSINKTAKGLTDKRLRTTSPTPNNQHEALSGKTNLKSYNHSTNIKVNSLKYIQPIVFFQFFYLVGLGVALATTTPNPALNEETLLDKNPNPALSLYKNPNVMMTPSSAF